MIGLLSASQSGLRVGSGVTVGALGGLIGIHASLVVSAAILLVLTLGLLVYAQQGRPAGVAEKEKRARGGGGGWGGGSGGGGWGTNPRGGVGLGGGGGGRPPPLP